MSRHQLKFPFSCCYSWAFGECESWKEGLWELYRLSAFFLIPFFVCLYCGYTCLRAPAHTHYTRIHTHMFLLMELAVLRSVLTIGLSTVSHGASEHKAFGSADPLPSTSLGTT